MTENPLAQFDRAAALAESVIAGVKPDQLDDPSPCAGWSVRQVINHLVTGSLSFASTLTGGPRPDPAADHLGADPLAAFRDAVRTLREAFAADGVLENIYPTPFGEGPGALLATMRVVEMTVHSWDIAKGSGQSTDLDPQLAEIALAVLRDALPDDRGGSPFGTAQPAAAGATTADRMAAFAGRQVA